VNVRVVREAGGIGDIVRLLPVLRGLRERYPSARIWLFAPAPYRALLRGAYDEFRPTPWHGRRPRDKPLDERRWRYLDAGVRFDLSIDLYCPAFRHEQRQRGNVWLDRIDLMCRAADVEPSSKLPQINLDPADLDAARRYLSDLSDRSDPSDRPLVALQPFSTDPARNWPVERWIRLADSLEKESCRVLVFDGCEGRTRAFRQHRVLGRPLGLVAALIAECDLVVGPDSGLLHVAAGVGTAGVGLFASQSPGVTYRYYPRHTYVYPAWDGQRHCRWPCHWARPARCCRRALQGAGKTCPMLARITVPDVLCAVRQRLATLHDPPPPRISLPAMPEAARRRLPRCKEIGALPIPHRDFALDRIALTRAVDHLAPVLREAYRVLRPGGALFLCPPSDRGVPSSLAAGFSVTESGPASLERWTKTGTWPRQAVARSLPSSTLAPAPPGSA